MAENSSGGQQKRKSIMDTVVGYLYPATSAKSDQGHSEEGLRSNDAWPFHVEPVSMHTVKQVAW